MRHSLLAGLTVALLACHASPAPLQPVNDPNARYDVVISGGRVVDGTGNPWFFGDVGIVGDRIMRVAPAGSLERAVAGSRIDAKGMVVAPGFIDMMGGSYDEFLLGGGRALNKVTQGITTEIMGELFTPAPWNDKMEPFTEFFFPYNDSVAVRATVAAFRNPHGFGSFLEAMERHGMSMNAASFLGAGTLRAYVKGQAQGPPTPAELDSMRAVMRRAMEDGALGLATALIYPPGNYASTEELVEMAKVMAPYHGIYITHMRSEADHLFEGIDEAFTIGREGGVPVEIYHLKAAGKRNWSKAAQAIAKIDSAQAAGQDVGADMYTAGGTALSACFPPWASADGKLLDNLRDSTSRAETHPRAYGTYPRILGRFVREHHVIPLEDAIRKMSSAAAERLSIADRGVLKEGFYADVVIFDPASVIDHATYERSHQLSTGIRDVFVNGVAVVRNGSYTGAKPGRALRGPGWNGRNLTMFSGRAPKH